MPGGPKEFLARAVPAFPLLVNPPYCPDLWPGPCRHQGSPVQGSLMPSVVSINLTPALPPLQASTGGPLPWSYRVVALCSYFPSTLCIRLALTVFRAVYWCLLKFDSSGVILRKNLRPGRLHSLAIFHTIPCPLRYSARLKYNYMKFYLNNIY